MSRRASDAETVLLQRNDRIFFFYTTIAKLFAQD